MLLAWFDPITLYSHGVQYILAPTARPPKGAPPDAELLSPLQAAWILDGLLNEPSIRSILRGHLGRARVSEPDRFWVALRAELARGNATLRRHVSRTVVWSVPTKEKAPPPPALGPEDTPEKTWFEVKVVDVFGDPVSGAEVTFTQGSLKEKAKTNGNGVARWRDVEGSSFATAKLSNPKELKESLKEVWGKKEAKEGLEGEKLSVLDDDLSTSLESEKPAVIVLYKPLARVRLIGMHFDTNKCFLRETAMNCIQHLVDVYDKYPNGKLLVVGHTDTTADDAYNLDLSVERAEAIKA
ncbi:MAG: OmpA family protein, partial [Polyangiales bacterium]